MTSRPPRFSRAGLIAMPYLRDRVIVLSKEPFREQDRRYVMYGREHGLLVAVARGASVRTSKQAGHLEPFCTSDVMIAKGSAFDKLAVAKMIDWPWRGSSPRLESHAVCGAFAELVARLTQPGIVDERMFDLVHDVFRVAMTLPSGTTVDRARLLLAASNLKLIDLIGFAPHIERPSVGTSPVPSLQLASFMRRASLSDVLNVTAPISILRSACAFVDEALRETPIHREPHGHSTIAAVLAPR
jgi:recombinational DNA repair protein (RecF pathway)